MAVIGHIDREEADWFSGFCSTYQVPFLSLDNHDIQQNQFYLSLMPDVLPALIAVIRRYQINQLAYIYDDARGARRLKSLMQLQTTNKLQNVNIISRYLLNPDDSYDLLQNIEIMTNPQSRQGAQSLNTGSKVTGRYIVLDFESIENYRRLLDKIKHRGMTTADYHYILLSLNARQLDMNYFRYGGVNVTFFSLASDSNQTSTNSYKDYIDSTNLNKEENIPSVESLLIVDAWETLLRTVNRMLSSTNETREKLKVFRHGRFYNGLTPGIDCRKSEIQPWVSGKYFLENLRETSFYGLTGQVQFSNRTGQRMNYTFDVYRVTRNEMPKNIGFFRAPTTLEVTYILRESL